MSKQSNKAKLYRLAAIAAVSALAREWHDKARWFYDFGPTRLGRPRISQKKRRLIHRRIGMFPTNK